MEIRRYVRPVQLPMWPDAVRGGPNALLRSAFFAGIASKHRKVLETRKSPSEEPGGIMVAAQDGITIKYTGTQLNQYDADVFFEVLHRSRRSSLGQSAFFTGSGFLTSIGRSRNDLNYADLDTSLRRLKRGVIDVSWRVNGRPYVYTGSLIDAYVRETDTKLYRVALSPTMVILFEHSSLTYIQWQERLSLMRAPLAQWLHSYYSTHARPYPVTASFLKEKTGHAAARNPDFMRTLRRALEVLKKELSWGVAWDGDLLKITRSPSDSQTRHVARVERRKELLKPKAPHDLPPSARRPVQRPVAPTGSSESRRGQDGLAPAAMTLASLLASSRK